MRGQTAVNRRRRRQASPDAHGRACRKHEYLAGIAVAQAVVTKKTDSPEFTAAAAALDKTRWRRSDAIGSIYGKAAGDAFLPLWRKHIGFLRRLPVGKS